MALAVYPGANVEVVDEGVILSQAARLWHRASWPFDKNLSVSLESTGAPHQSPRPYLVGCREPDCFRPAPEVPCESPGCV